MANFDAAQLSLILRDVDHIRENLLEVAGHLRWDECPIVHSAQVHLVLNVEAHQFDGAMD